jgi:hypothetical protein
MRPRHSSNTSRWVVPACGVAKRWNSGVCADSAPAKAALATADTHDAAVRVESLPGIVAPSEAAATTAPAARSSRIPLRRVVPARESVAVIRGLIAAAPMGNAA